MRVVAQADPQAVVDVFPQVSVGTDVSIDSDNYWALTLHHVNVVAQYRGNRIASVELSQGFRVPRQGTATFPVDLIPDTEDPAESGQHYTSDCVVPQQQESAGLLIAGGAVGGQSPGTTADPTWPMTLIITVQILEIGSWTPTVSVTIPDIAMPCASMAASTVSIAAPSAGGGSEGQKSECLIG
eukprot:COSAG02_NODE_111_length_36009_cov_42.221248_22_plen_184_part_00